MADLAPRPVGTIASMSNLRSIGRRAAWLPLVAAALMLSGCEVTRSVVGGPGPIPIGPSGPIVANPNGGPPVECRGIPVQQCLQSAPVELGRNDIARVVVTCTKVCTPTQGEFRLDLVLADGRIEGMGGGGYSSAPAAPAPAPVEPEASPEG
jgi:hypothetical protein